MESVLDLIDVEHPPEIHTAMWLLNNLRAFCLERSRERPRQRGLFKLSKLQRKVVSNVAHLHGEEDPLVNVIWAGVGGWLLQLMERPDRFVPPSEKKLKDRRVQ